jgi:hypothetical protein
VQATATQRAQSLRRCAVRGRAKPSMPSGLNELAWFESALLILRSEQLWSQAGFRNRHCACHAVPHAGVFRIGQLKRVCVRGWSGRCLC